MLTPLSLSPIGYSLDTTTIPMLMFMIPLLTELLVHLAAFLRVGFKLPHETSLSAAQDGEGDKGRSSVLSAATAVLSYGPATAT